MIYFEKDFFQSKLFFSCMQMRKKIAVICDTSIEEIYLDRWKKVFSEKKISFEYFSFPHGEKSKNRKVKESLENQLLSKGFTKDTLIIAFGGGVTTDLAGFIAATFCRGVPYISIPTTLLAMVDASIGGKVGVNTKFGKNLIGAFHHPDKIFIDINFLSTLELIEIKSGMVEVIKTALLADENLFFSLLENKEKILSLDLSFYEKIVKKTVLIKQKIISLDEKDHGIRGILNLGHTIGHAVESAANYSISHGHSVAVGLCVEAYISNRLGLLSTKEFNLIKQIFSTLEIAVCLNKGFCEKSFQKALVLDKKSKDKKIFFSLLEKIEKPYQIKGKYTVNIEDPLLKEAVDWMIQTCS